MKEITKEVILDLLPLYLAGEVSEKTEELVKKYLEDDPELAEKAKEMAKADSLGKVPIPFKKESALETYNEAKKWMTIRVLGLAGIAGLVFICFFLTILIGTAADKLIPYLIP
jgi:Fe2+ transport system protein B